MIEVLKAPNAGLEQSELASNLLDVDLLRRAAMESFSGETHHIRRKDSDSAGLKLFQLNTKRKKLRIVRDLRTCIMQLSIEKARELVSAETDLAQENPELKQLEVSCTAMQALRSRKEILDAERTAFESFSPPEAVNLLSYEEQLSERSIEPLLLLAQSEVQAVEDLYKLHFKEQPSSKEDTAAATAETKKYSSEFSRDISHVAIPVSNSTLSWVRQSSSASLSPRLPQSSPDTLAHQTRRHKRNALQYLSRVEWALEKTIRAVQSHAASLTPQRAALFCRRANEYMLSRAEAALLAGRLALVDICDRPAEALSESQVQSMNSHFARHVYYTAEACGLEHPRTACALWELVLAFIQQQSFESAVHVSRRIVKILTDWGTEGKLKDLPHTPASSTLLGVCEKVRHTFRRFLGSTTHDTAEATFLQALLEQHFGMHDLARRHFERAHQLFQALGDKAMLCVFEKWKLLDREEGSQSSASVDAEDRETLGNAEVPGEDAAGSCGVKKDTLVGEPNTRPVSA
ncbi:MAG: hypothetical protein MHM6MM_002981 [Cercozoa sp. M6MM]